MFKEGLMYRFNRYDHIGRVGSTTFIKVGTKRVFVMGLNSPHTACLVCRIGRLRNQLELRKGDN